LAKSTNIDGIVFRLAGADDIQRIHLIEQRSNPLPWTQYQLQSSLKFHQIWIAERKTQSTKNQILAFLIAQEVLDEASLLHIVVDADKQSQGIGRFLLESWLDELPQAIAKIWLEVRQSNVCAQKLYRDCGFIKTGSRQDYYQKNLSNPQLAKETADIFCLRRVSS